MGNRYMERELKRYPAIPAWFERVQARPGHLKLTDAVPSGSH